ncbi:MAG: indolepyruvate ferredoxin oxidoreductase subunit alpha [Clostridia bacterium]|nr:indolepyruvate ferredoxin oxidoreductase subunit alpha [Clostridia bacterium]MBR5365674.1 indolepyruvate ferredoxin oxidoreductase subunit alpha [Clostridia bacterium]
MKTLLLGNESVARGLYEAGVRFVSSYPGTPSTEITEFAATYPEIYAEWAPNEKVALEGALGAAIGGGRSFCGMKHVGLNVAADPLFVTAYTGVGAGMVIGVADDPGMHSSQNEQDSRHYAIAAKLPMVEPANSAECRAYTKIAYEISERFDTPVILRLTTRVSHSRSPVEAGERVEREIAPYVKEPGKHVMMPANAKKRHVVVEEHLAALAEYAETTELNTVEENGTPIGIITAGNCYNYAKEAFGKNASYLKLGLLNPLPKKLIEDFAAKHERLIVIEELDPVIENHCRALGLKVTGKDVLPLCDEYSEELLRSRLLGIEPDYAEVGAAIPARPPVLCPGCPHRGVFYTLAKLKLRVSGDIGCYTLGAVPPLSAIDSVYCMGASISSLHGTAKVRGEEDKYVAVIGDSTFMHSGLTGLVNVVYNGGNTTTLILDNSITGMTGHQDNPLTGKTLKGDPAPNLSLEDICASLGVAREHIRAVDPNNLEELEKIVKEEVGAPCPSVVICRRPCALLKSVKKNPPIQVDWEKCVGCKNCMKIGCPCISVTGKKATIDQSMCVGCGLCEQMCRFGAL